MCGLLLSLKGTTHIRSLPNTIASIRIVHRVLRDHVEDGFPNALSSKVHFAVEKKLQVSSHDEWWVHFAKMHI